MKKQAFTLAEVLITLGIIGVVAALTIPTLMQKTNEREIISQLKKEYTILSQAFSLVQVEYGTIDKWGMATTAKTGQKDEEGNDLYDRSSQELFANRLKEHLNVLQECNKDSSCKNMNRYSLGGTKIGERSTWYNNGTPSFFLNDGTFISIGWYTDSDRKIDIVVALPKSKNLTVGKTEFYFQATPKGIIPSGLPETTTPFDTYCKTSSTSSNAGRGCTAWVIYRENMDYLHCNDLSWNGKTKCD